MLSQKQLKVHHPSMPLIFLLNILAKYIIQKNFRFIIRSCSNLKSVTIKLIMAAFQESCARQFLLTKHYQWSDFNFPKEFCLQNYPPFPNLEEPHSTTKESTKKETFVFTPVIKKKTFMSKCICQLCPRRFMTQKQLDNHFNKSHEVRRNFVCHFCPSKFKLKKKLWNHTIKYHADEDISQNITPGITPKSESTKVISKGKSESIFHNVDEMASSNSGQNVEEVN